MKWLSEKELILASGSSRRKDFMQLMQIPFKVSPSDINELQHPGEDSVELVKRLAREKAYAAVEKFPEHPILAADTVVVLGGKVLGKPESVNDAKTMLQELSGKIHEVTGAFTFVDQSKKLEIVESSVSMVRFVDLSEECIQLYIQTGEPLDKAGSYGIQGVAAMFVAEIDGSYSNIVGLDVCKLRSVLREHGYYR